MRRKAAGSGSAFRRTVGSGSAKNDKLQIKKTYATVFGQKRFLLSALTAKKKKYGSALSGNALIKNIQNNSALHCLRQPGGNI